MSQISDFKSAPMDLYKTSTDISLATMVGSKFRSGDGREFVLVQNAGTAIASGVVVQGPAAQANAVGLSPATTSTTGYLASLGPIAGVIGGKTIQIATGATAVLVNRFAGGYLNVVEGTGLGQTMKIASNTAASTTSAMGVVLEDAFSVATSTDSRFTFTINPYGSKNGTDFTTDGVIISPATTLTGVTLGVSFYPIPASTATVPSYGFIQTKGPVAVLGSSTVALGIDVCVPSGTPGAVVTYAVATGPRIGTAVVATASTKYNIVNLDM
jgi:multisubunit Na+/H+ antiporter MnhF subunit